MFYRPLVSVDTSLPFVPMAMPMSQVQWLAVNGSRNACITEPWTPRAQGCLQLLAKAQFVATLASSSSLSPR